MRANRILETALYCPDLDEAEKFYTQLLGHPPQSAMKPRHLFYRCGDGMLLIFNPNETKKAFGDIDGHGCEGIGHAAFYMAEEEIDATRDWLKELGIEITSEVKWPQGGTSIYFRDPAGNSLEFATPQLWGIE